ncbi:MAG: transporter substrate-binding domain-containing protein [Actinobacteria bacterium]|nr:transporter substrate-binding domain-containing protein [Actinomycetota bacterium]
MHKKRLFYTLLILSLVLIFAGCAGKSEKSKEEAKENKESKIETITPGVLTVGSDVAFPPFEFEDEKTQEIVGFDVDLIKEIGKRIGLQVKIQPAAFDTIIQALNAKKFDCVVSAMTITDERKQQVDFSDPYIDSNQSLAVKSGSPIKSIEDLKGRIVGVQRGTTGELKAQEIKEKYGIKEIKSYDDTLMAFEDLKAGRIDAVINDYPVTAYLVKKDPFFEIVAEIPTGEKYGIAVRKDSKALLEAINKALADMKKDGTYEKIYKKWFGNQ